MTAEKLVFLKHHRPQYCFLQIYGLRRYLAMLQKHLIASRLFTRLLVLPCESPGLPLFNELGSGMFFVNSSIAQKYI